MLCRDPVPCVRTGDRVSDLSGTAYYGMREEGLDTCPIWSGYSRNACSARRAIGRRYRAVGCCGQAVRAVPEGCQRVGRSLGKSFSIISGDTRQEAGGSRGGRIPASTGSAPGLRVCGTSGQGGSGDRFGSSGIDPSLPIYPNDARSWSSATVDQRWRCLAPPRGEPAPGPDHRGRATSVSSSIRT